MFFMTIDPTRNHSPSVFLKTEYALRLFRKLYLLAEQNLI